MPDPYHHGSLRDALIDSALALLEAGDGAPSLREVARRAGVSAMAPYRHFEDRRALLTAVAERGFILLRDRLEAADADPDPQEALIAQGRAYIAFALAHPALFRLMFAGDLCSKPQPGDDTHGVLYRRAAGIAPDEAESSALACWSLVHGLATLSLDQRLGPVADDTMTATLSLLIRGMTAPK